jgi:hypothetical protein
MTILRADGTVETCGKCAAIGTNGGGSPGAHAPDCTFANDNDDSQEWWAAYRVREAASAARWAATKARLGMK